MTKSFKIGDLVWAKKKGFCPLPGLVSKPRNFVKKPSSDRDYIYVYFFGTKYSTYIETKNIKPYEELKEKLISTIKRTHFKKAVLDVTNYVNRIQPEPNFNPATFDSREESTTSTKKRNRSNNELDNKLDKRLLSCSNEEGLASKDAKARKLTVNNVNNTKTTNTTANVKSASNFNVIVLIERMNIQQLAKYKVNAHPKEKALKDLVTNDEDKIHSRVMIRKKKKREANIHRLRK